MLLAALALLILLPFHLVAVKFGGCSAMKVAQLWQRFVCFLIGIRVTVTGAPAGRSPAAPPLQPQFLARYPDPRGRRAGLLHRQEGGRRLAGGRIPRQAQRTVFVDRTRRHATGAQAGEVASRLSKGDIMVLFAEGTSSDGNKVLPFRSALVGAAQMAIGDGGVATVQPVAIAYQKMLGLPLGRQHRPLVAWYGGHRPACRI